MTKLDAKLVRKMGLSPERIQTHANRIRAALAGETDTFIPVDDSCTVDNGGIIAWDVLESWLADAAARKGEAYFSDAHRYWAKHHLVTMVPAAGAASRFLGELRKFTDEVEAKVDGLAEGVRKKQNKALANAEKFHEVAAEIELKPAMAAIVDKVEEQEFIDVVREYIRIGVLLGIFHDVEFTAEKSKSGKKILDLSEREWRFHWGDLLGDEQIDDSDDADDECGGCCGSKCGEGGCSDCDCDAQESEPVSRPSVLKTYAAAKAILNLYAGEPKALVPTTVEGDSFLRLKMVEQVSLLRGAGNVLVVPAGQKQKVQKIVKDEGEYLKNNYANVFELEGTPFAPAWLKGGVRETGKWSVMEQGNDLSTIRFGMNAEPVLEKGKYSLVAAGHGELVHLFSKVSTEFPKAECLHVRNIDNVVGASSDMGVQISELTDSFRLIRDAIEFLRAEVASHLASARIKKDSRMINADVCLALDFLGVLMASEIAERSLAPCFSPEGDFLGISAESVFGILAGLFHWQSPPSGCTGKALWQLIEKNIARPLSVFGVVKKENGDVGGGPVFIRLPDGSRAKLCMEMPHANPEDSKKYFAAGGKCTHFNPVLTFFELKTNGYSLRAKKGQSKKVDFRRLFDDRFWMLSRKEYQGKPVCYHETVLYELIGNSATTNLVFFEVPRSLFVPHKTIFESLGRSRESYGFAETLGKRNGDES